MWNMNVCTVRVCFCAIKQNSSGDIEMPDFLVMWLYHLVEGEVICCGRLMDGSTLPFKC